MKELKATITENPFYWSPEFGTILTKKFDNTFPAEIFYINLLLKYPVEKFKNADLFQYLDQDSLNRLKTDNNTILIFDSIFEGFGPDEVPIADALYQNCLLHKINPNKIFFFTGNLNHREEKINVIPIFLLAEKVNWENQRLTNFKDARRLCAENYEKIILSLSRRNRFHRVLAHCMLFNSDLYQDSIISQDKTNTVFHDHLINELGLTKNQITEFVNSLPLIADKNQFDVNEPFNPLTELHSKTLFSIVNETLACNLNNTTFFFSEKFLKPIINFQPMLIYGHQGINKKLTMLGFKTYENYFDLSFDDEPNDILRYKKLLSSARQVVRKLKTMSRDEQLQWRFQHRKILKHNRQVFLEYNHTEKSLDKFSKILKNIN